MLKPISTTKRLLITAALPYSNDDIHMGHIGGAYLPADTFVRFKRLRGVDVRFICGSDDHGVPIMLSAYKRGESPAQIAKYYHDRQLADFKSLSINFDVYGATSQCLFHVRTSQDFFLRIHEEGLFEKRSSYQFYDESRKIFLPDRFVKGSCAYCSAADQYGDQCENCGKLLDTETLLNPTSAVSGTPASIRETSHWFLDLTRCEKEVSTWLENAYLRETTRSYVRGLISTGLVKRSMTRDLDWGVPVPLSDPEAQNKVLYVWFDAPIGYISNTKELCESSNGKAEQYTEWWKNPDCDIVHFIGEDNTVFHCVIWIAMLKAEGTFRLPRSVVVNQFINVQFPGKEPEKMSKSRGTAVWIKDTLAQGIGPDSLRYYLTCIAPERARAVYKPDDLVQRHNSELANTLGNFVHRIVSFTLKYCGPKVPNYNQGLLNETDLKFQADLKAAFNETTEFLEACYCRSALDRIMEFCRVCNRYVDSQAPWTTRKSYMPRTEATLALALNAIKFLSVTLSPFIPESAQKIQKILNLDTAKLCWQDAVQPLAGGAALNEPQILFAKIEGQPKTA